MIKHLNYFLIPLLLQITTSTNYDYEISRGRKMWAGMYNAVHYYDHFTFLTDKITNIQGVFTSYYAFNTGNNWSLNYELVLKGNLETKKDGFLMILTKEPPSPKDLNGKFERNNLFVDEMPRKNGFKMFFNGGENKLFVSYGDKGQENGLSCDLDLVNRKKINFYLKGNGNSVIVSYHYDDSTDYEKCVEVFVPGNSMNAFFPIFYARSAGSSAFQIDVNSMTLSTIIENIGISTFEAKFDENMPKLFKKISFLKKNSEYLKSKEKKTTPENLNIKSITRTQSTVYKQLDYSNSQIQHSLEESDIIVSYLDQQKFSSDNFGHNVLNGIQSWLDDSMKQYQEMDSDINNIVTEIKTFDFDGLVNETQTLLDNLDLKLKDNEDDINQFKKFSFVINSNLKLMKEKGDLNKNFEKNLEEFFKKNKGDDKNLNGVFTFLLSVMGIVIIFVLLAILWRLNRSLKKEVF